MSNNVKQTHAQAMLEIAHRSKKEWESINTMIAKRIANQILERIERDITYYRDHQIYTESVNVTWKFSENHTEMKFEGHPVRRTVYPDVVEILKQEGYEAGYREEPGFRYSEGKIISVKLVIPAVADKEAQ